MKKIMFGISLIVLIISLCIIKYIHHQPAITYFPPANPEDASFIEANTSMHVHQNNFITQSTSKSNMPLFLRQDVSLTFRNGKLISLQHKWEEHAKDIQLKEEIPLTDNGLYEAVTFHYGELHQTNDDIKSIQNMTNNWLYVYKNNRSILTFKDVLSTKEKHLKKQFDDALTEELQQQLNTLSQHFDINLDHYTAMPLTELTKYHSEPLPKMTQPETNKIIGQLWEGVYKNYAIPILKQDKQRKSTVPFILFSKQADHLLVLFNINGEFKLLKQTYSR